jgi:DNA repair exonuclease SbcCD ATPase subunit
VEFLSKQIISWSETLPDWQGDLLRRVVGGGLDEMGREEIAKLLLGESDAPTPCRLRAGDLRAEDEPESPVTLVAVKEVQGINALLRGQPLRVEDGLTIVYGNNGSGKSGFGRLFRYMCRAIAVPTILPDVFRPFPAAQTARVVIRRDGTEHEIEVDLAVQPDQRLSAMRVFDAECAQTYVRQGNAVEHAPEPLGMLTRCVSEQDQIAALLRRSIEAKRAALPAGPVLPKGTRVACSVAELGAETDLAELRRETELSDTKKLELERLEAELRSVEADDLTNVEQTARNAVAAAVRLADRLQSDAAAVGPRATARVNKLRRELGVAESSLHGLRREALSGQPLSGTGTESWRVMWEAARRFIELEDRPFPPLVSEPCPVCQRPVDPPTQDRLVRFEQFVTSDLEAQFVSRREQLQSAIKAMPSAHEARPGVTAELATLDEDLRGMVFDAYERLQARRDGIANDEDTPEVRVGTVVAALRSRADSQLAIAERQVELHEPEQRDRLRDVVAELRGRRDAIAAFDVVERRHAALVDIREIENAVGALDTRAMTRKQNELAKLAVTGTLVDAIQDELDQMGGLSGRVKVVASGSKGSSVLRVELVGAKKRPADILSEGEHRAVAMAFFFGELAVAGGSSTIIFDDPVSSLDHLRRDDVASRLVREASRRQVIVFTHELSFLHHLTGAAEADGVRVTHRYLTRDSRGTGIVTTEPPIKQVSLQKRGAELRGRITRNLQPLWDHNLDAYDIKTTEWLNDLRKSWEMLIEDGLFCGVVKRFDARVYVYKLRHLAIPAGASDRIRMAFARLSAQSHQQAAAAHSGPLSPARL